MSTDPVLQAVLQAAADATQADFGWLTAVDGEAGLTVVAAVGEGTEALVGMTAPLGEGASGFVAASGQPLALTARPDDPRVSTGIAARLPHPVSSVVCVPCEGVDDVVGTIELVERRGGSFSFDDIELATLLAGVAGVALGERRTVAPPPDPASVTADLQQLAEVHPERYDAVRTLLAGLLGSA